MTNILMIILFAIVHICIGVFVTAMIKKFFAGDWSICVFIWPLVAAAAVVGGLAYLSYWLGSLVAAWLIGLMDRKEVVEE